MTSRIVLVPRGGSGLGPGAAPIRRYGLARVGVSRRSALGVDRHERLEQVVEREREARPPGETSAADTP